MPSTPSQQEEFLTMLKRYQQGRATQDEMLFIEKYMEQLESEADILESFTAEDRERLKEEMRVMLMRRINEKAPAKVISMQRRWRRIAAAAIVAGIGLSAYFFTRTNHPNMAKVENQAPVHDVVPGGNKATLTLADGSAIELESTKNGMLAEQGNTSILKVNDQLSYDADAGEEGTVQYNTLATPRGGQYKVVLSDGTKVWLNASSSLYYPAHFNGAKRSVKLTGEAFFEVAHNADKPFMVEAETIKVHDIGTSFNINAYPGEKGITATLVSGLAAVTTNDEKLLLQPGKQAVVTGSNITLSDADIEQNLAWRNGLFSFANADIQAVMRQVERWYDVEVQFEGTVLKHFSGNISRNQNASEVFKKLELTGGVHFTIEGKKVIVRP